MTKEISPKRCSDVQLIDRLIFKSLCSYVLISLTGHRKTVKKYMDELKVIEGEMLKRMGGEKKKKPRN